MITKQNNKETYSTVQEVAFPEVVLASFQKVAAAFLEAAYQAFPVVLAFEAYSLGIRAVVLASYRTAFLQEPSYLGVVLQLRELVQRDRKEPLAELMRQSVLTWEVHVQLLDPYPFQASSRGLELEE